MSGNCSLSCPVLTSLDHDGVQFTCMYTSWAYGLAAALLFIGGLLPIGLLIYFFARLKNSASRAKGNLRRQDSDASTFTDVSRPHDHSVYEVGSTWNKYYSSFVLGHSRLGYLYKNQLLSDLPA